MYTSASCVRVTTSTPGLQSTHAIRSPFRSSQTRSDGSLQRTPSEPRVSSRGDREERMRLSSRHENRIVANCRRLSNPSVLAFCRQNPVASRRRSLRFFVASFFGVRPFSRAIDSTHGGYSSRLETSQLTRRVDRCEHSRFCERVSLRRPVAGDLAADGIGHALVRPGGFDRWLRRRDTRQGSRAGGGSR